MVPSVSVTDGLLIGILVLLIIIVVVILYFASIVGKSVAFVTKTINDAKKKFGKITSTVLAVADKVSDEVQNKILPAIEKLQPDIDDLISQSGDLAKAYIEKGIVAAKMKLNEIKGSLPQVMTSQGINYGSC